MSSLNLQSPGDMLPYVVLQWIGEVRNASVQIYHDRKMAKTTILLLRQLDAQLEPLRTEMQWTDWKDGVDAEPLDYWQTRVKIEEFFKKAYDDIDSKFFDNFQHGLIIWLELIASSYPKLSLLPELGGEIDEDAYGGTEDPKKLQSQLKEDSEFDNVEQEIFDEEVKKDDEPIHPKPNPGDGSSKNEESVVSSEKTVSDEW